MSVTWFKVQVRPVHATDFTVANKGSGSQPAPLLNHRRGEGIKVKTMEHIDCKANQGV